jgi:hypothetical protein
MTLGEREIQVAFRSREIIFHERKPAPKEFIRDYVSLGKKVLVLGFQTSLQSGYNLITHGDEVELEINAKELIHDKQAAALF